MCVFNQTMYIHRYMPIAEGQGNAAGVIYPQCFAPYYDLVCITKAGINEG